MYKNECVFPCSNNLNDIGLFNIYRAVANHIFTKIPIHLFKTVILDFKDNMKDIYAYKNGELVNIKEVEKLALPSITIEFIGNGNNYKDTQFNSISTPFQNYAGAEGINLEKRGLNAIYSDKYNIQLFTSDIFCKSTFNITFSVQTLDDRNNLANILDTNLKQHYGYELKEIETKYLLPNSLISYLREALFQKELNALKENQNSLSLERIKEVADTIDINFVNHISDYSNGIITHFIKNSKYGQDEIRLSYNRLSNAYYKLDNELNLGDGEKRGDLYDKYSITGSGYIEYYNPIAFVLSLPSVIRGEWIKNYIIESTVPNKNFNINIKKMNTIFVDNREVSILGAKYKHYSLIYEDREFVCENGIDKYPILLKIMEDNQHDRNLSKISYDFYKEYKEEYIDPNDLKQYILNYVFDDITKFSIIDMLIYMIPRFDKQTINELFTSVVWEDNKLKDKKEYELSDLLEMNLTNTNSELTYSHKIYADLTRIRIKFNLLFY